MLGTLCKLTAYRFRLFQYNIQYNTERFCKKLVSPDNTAQFTASLNAVQPFEQFRLQHTLNWGSVPYGFKNSIETIQKGVTLISLCSKNKTAALEVIHLKQYLYFKTMMTDLMMTVTNSEFGSWVIKGGSGERGLCPCFLNFL